MLLKYVYASDDQITDGNNNDNNNEESFHFQDLDNIFQSANCLDLSYFISDNTKNNTSVMNKYLEKESKKRYLLSNNNVI